MLKSEVIAKCDGFSNAFSDTPKLISKKDILKLSSVVQFGVKDISRTTDTHYKRIQKLKANKVKLSEIFYDGSTDEIYANTIHNKYFRFCLKDKPLNKPLIKSLKQLINNTTRAFIQKSLEWYDYPTSYDTGFYCLYYTSINRTMKAILKDIIKYEF